MLHKHGHLTVVVAYAPTEDSTMNSKDEFYITLEAVVSSRPHNQIVVLGNFSAVTGADRAGFEGVIGNFSFGCRNVGMIILFAYSPRAQRQTSPFWGRGFNEGISIVTLGCRMMVTHTEGD